jgi:hypothetical protein
LIYAAHSGYTEIVKLLIADQKIDLNGVDEVSALGYFL